MLSGRFTRIALVVAACMIVAAAAGYLLLAGLWPASNGAAPAPTFAASATLASAPATSGSATPAPTTPPAPILFRIAPDESRVQYEVNEVFITETNRLNVAVGVTQDVSGTVLVDPANPKRSRIGAFAINIQKFKSDQPLRDLLIQKLFLESAKYPLATFVPSQTAPIPDTYTPGDDLSFKVTGDLTVRTVTRPVTFDATVKGDAKTVTGVATTKLLMTDFGFGPIEFPGPTGIGGIIKTENEVRLTFTFVAHGEPAP